MTKAHEVAAELRKFADCLDTEPDAEVVRVYINQFYYNKEPFLAMSKLIPRPLAKVYGTDRLLISHDTEAVCINVSIPRDKVCTLVKEAQPAVYECEPLLSAEDETKL